VARTGGSQFQKSGPLREARWLWGRPTSRLSRNQNLGPQCSVAVAIAVVSVTIFSRHCEAFSPHAVVPNPHRGDAARASRDRLTCSLTAPLSPRLLARLFDQSRR